MNHSLDYLPKEKQIELSKIVQFIQEISSPELIILFGSYARNEWVEDMYNEEHYRYKSDFDLLVIVATKSETSQNRFEIDIEQKIANTEDIKTPTSIIVHDIYYVNTRLAKGQYFFSDIKKEGIVLHDSGRFQLQEAKVLLPPQRRKLAQEDFNYWFKKAYAFFDGYYFYFEKDNFPMAAFMLHQATERLLSGILLVFTRYKPNTHDLEELRKIVNSVTHQLIPVFPLDTVENKRLFTLLRKAYVDARYKPSYVITHEELLQLSEKS